MKKTYYIPTMDVVKIQGAAILAGSNKATVDGQAGLTEGGAGSASSAFSRTFSGSGDDE